MENPELYAQNNHVQRTEIQRLLDEYIHLIYWKSRGGDSVMDIGCGPGNITTEILLPMLPQSLQELVATDMSPKMVQYAQSHQQRPQVSYEVLDIATKTLPPAYNVRFDHIFSTYCLHWVHDQRQAMNNIYNMLRPGGDILLMYIAQHPFFDVWLQLASREDWKQYMVEPTKYTAAHQYETHVEYSLRGLLQEIGYMNITCHCRGLTHVYENTHTCMSSKLLNYTYLTSNHYFRLFCLLPVNMSSVNPHLSQLPDNLRDRYLREVMVELMNKLDLNGSTSKDNDQLLIPYSMIIINATKPAQTF